MPRSNASSTSSSLSPSSKHVGSVARKKSRPLGRPKAPITSIPDMRFEQSFLASIKAFIHEEDVEHAKEMKEQRRSNSDKRQRVGEHSAEAARNVRTEGFEEKFKLHEDSAPPKVMKSRSPHGEPELWLGRLRIEWWPLLYLTVRDQLFSPIIQGAIFGLGGLALGHVRGYFVARRQHQQQQRASSGMLQ